MTQRKPIKKDVEGDYEEPSKLKGKRKKRKIADSKDGVAQHPKSKALLQPMVDMPIDVLLEVRLEIVVLTGSSELPRYLNTSNWLTCGICHKPQNRYAQF